jgi:hypothetical protein
MWIEYNPNPCGRLVNDCAVRAIAKALGLTWEKAYVLLTTFGYDMCDMPSANSVWGAVLRENGFSAKAVPDKCPHCYTAEDFCKEWPKGTFVLGFGNHVATIVDGKLYDAWDSSKEIVLYAWYRKEEING